MIEIMRHDGPGRVSRLRINGKVVGTPNLVFPLLNGPFSLPVQAEITVVVASSSGALVNATFREKVRIVGTIGPLLLDLEEALNMELKSGGDILMVPSTPVIGPREVAQQLMLEVIENTRVFRKLAGGSPIAAPIYYIPYKDLWEEYLSGINAAGAEMYVLKGLNHIIHNPRELAAFMTAVNKFISPNAVVYAVGVPPSHYLHLTYLGVDLFDAANLIGASLNGLYLFEGKWYQLKDFKSLPCFCDACVKLPSVLSEDERFQLLFKHNVLSALGILRKAELLIRSTQLREGVEAAAHCSTELTALLRILDRDAQRLLEKYTPISGKGKVHCVGPESYYRPSLERFRGRVAERYTPPKWATAVLLLPCSARKPYSQSPSHKLFRRVVEEAGVKSICEGIVTSPLGLVPRELEEVYPAAHYDVPVTGDWDAEEIEIAAKCISKYIEKFPDDCAIVAHLDGGYLKACKKASEIAGKDIIYTEIEGNPTSSSSLLSLRETLERVPSEEVGWFERVKEAFRSVADYQFGVGAGDLLVKQGTHVKVERKGVKRLYRGDVLLAASSPSTGLIVPTMNGGEILAKRSHWVLFRGEMFRGSSIMAPGVEDADPNIRPGDVVFVINSLGRLIGVGEANLSGEEMVEVSRGVAVKIKHARRGGS